MKSEFRASDFEFSDRESALVETVAPGNYTAIVRGNSGTTGVGLVKVYHVP